MIRHTALADVTVATFFLVMNKERWEALPGEAQALLDDLSGEALALRAAQVSDETEAAGAELASQKGVELYRLPPDELALEGGRGGRPPAVDRGGGGEGAARAPRLRGPGPALPALPSQRSPR